MTPHDQAARHAITTETARNMFVVAGAGSGKTSALVARITTLVVRDGIRLRNIAAVTFTEKAGAELRDRLRAKFERSASLAETDDERSRALQALEDLDTAAIGTLHSFAQRILLLHPIEAGLPPKLDVLDEVGSSISLEEQWQRALLSLLEEPSIAPALQRALLSGKLDQLESLFKALTNDWDLIDSHVLAHEPAPLDRPLPPALLSAAAALNRTRTACLSADSLLTYLDKASAMLPGLADGDDLVRYQALLGAAALTTILRDDGSYKRIGSAGNWLGLAGGIDEAKAAYDQFRSEAIHACAQAQTIVLSHITTWLARRVLASADERRRNGELIFHDLLVLARQVLREDSSVTESISRRYTHLLLDEFQDTDPIQIEIAVRIAGGAAGAAHPNWQDITIPAGSLFVVGDPKQSIYRFRRADIALYLNVQDWFETQFGRESIVLLDTNFRSVPGLLTWVNEAFGELIKAEPARQPRYDPTRPPTANRWAAPPHHQSPTSGWTRHEFRHVGNATRLREMEADGVAAIISRAVQEQWPVQEVNPLSGQTLTRPIQRSDIAVLVPARTSLPILRRTLDDAGIPYRAEASSLMYQSEDVAELLLAAQAVADRSDTFALVMTLRSPLFGLGDDDLWRWKQSGGSFSLASPPTGPNAEMLCQLPVHLAMDHLRRLSFEAHRLTPADLLDRLIRERRALEVVADAPDAADRWRRLRFVIDQARAWSENAHGGIRAYLEWAKRQSSETARVYEAILPETDLDAVRVLTIHAAKGLEYPMVILSGLTALPRNQTGVRLLWTRRQLRHQRDLRTPDNQLHRGCTTG